MAPQPVTLQDLLTILDNTMPFSLAESWDNVGLMLGDPRQKISRVLIGLDPTLELVNEAISENADLIINHHPLIFTPLEQIRTDQPTGHFILEAIKNNISVVGCHTNLDVINNGVSHSLAKLIGLEKSTPLKKTTPDSESIGFGRVGALQAGQDSEAFLSHVCKVLGLPVLKICGPLPAQINRVAVCGGSGSDLAECALSSGAQVYITGEVKHSVARWAEQSGLCIIDAGHFATENLIIEKFAKKLSEELKSQGMEVSVRTSSQQSNPFNFYIKPQ